MVKTRQAALVGPRQWELFESELELKPGFVLVKLDRAYLCGSELHYHRGNYPDYVKLPMKLGHEGAGTVVEVGPGVEGWQVGDKAVVYADVMISPSGATNLYADYSLAPARCLQRIPEGVPVELGALAEPLASALHCGYHTGVEVGDTVVVFGGGFAGLVVAQIAKAAGAGALVVVDMAEEKLELAKKLGADLVVNAAKVDAAAYITEQLGKNAVDVAVDAVGTARVIDQATDVLRKEGQLILYGWVTRPATINLSTWHTKGLRPRVTKIGSYVEKMPWAERGFKLYKQGKLPLEALVSACYPLGEIQAAFDRYDTDPAMIKIGLGEK
ncbi:MAG: zinc-dependent alcohol dehydrogenase [Chitinophagales bacterium]